MIHFKYSELEAICFLCFLYGPGIPILFPIGLICLIFNYLIDSYLVARLYREPPYLRHEILDDLVRNLLYPPIFYTAFGFWMYGARDIFENHVNPIDS